MGIFSQLHKQNVQKEKETKRNGRERAGEGNEESDEENYPGCNVEQDRQAGLGRAASLESANSLACVYYSEFQNAGAIDAFIDCFSRNKEILFV